ncbi:hypothetical protein [Mycobacterium sp. E2479]|uniref:hypothetical protein n=1 Tax=Mycobacterium sp. E2479 TaxID=1834134 RepID=UPI0009EE2359|nr:hypothetical protein [Mycobacterium sp. E2479]
MSDSQPIKVFQVATGNVGSEMIKRLATQTDLELIGVLLQVGSASSQTRMTPPTPAARYRSEPSVGKRIMRYAHRTS